MHRGLHSLLSVLLGMLFLLIAGGLVTTAGQSSPKATPTGLLNEDDRPRSLRAMTSGWRTNWQRHTIPYSELISGGPPRDGIPSIDKPAFITPEQAQAWLADNEPVIALEIDGDARAYPLQILIWHEIANDVVGGVPVIVTFCPLCNAALTFDRRLDGVTYTFGTSGLLHNSDLVMYDRVTESLWQQFTGFAIVGDLTGARLKPLPSSIVSFAAFRMAYSSGKVLSRETGYARDYGHNPYVGYDRIGDKPFLFDKDPDGRLPAMERVVAVSVGSLDITYPYSVLAKVGVINDTRDGHDLVILYLPGTASALDVSQIANGADIGATGVFESWLDGRKLTFRRAGMAIRDSETDSTWTILGQSTDGPLADKRLTPIVHGDYFWFAWAAFKPETIIYKEPGE